MLVDSSNICLNNSIKSWNFIKYCKFCFDISKTALKYTKAKNDQIDKPFYFWQKDSKKAPNGNHDWLRMIAIWRVFERKVRI